MPTSRPGCSTQSFSGTERCDFFERDPEAPQLHTAQAASGGSFVHVLEMHIWHRDYDFAHAVVLEQLAEVVNRAEDEHAIDHG